MPKPEELIAATSDAHARLHEAVHGLDDAMIARPSLLPGWTIGHVIAHLARNADSVTRRLRAAGHGELVPQYDGGAPTREREIADGAGRPAAELLADLLSSDADVEATFAELTDEVWDRPVLDGSSRQVPATHLPFARWREVETHLVDLGLGHRAADWPQPLVDRWLPELLDRLPTRTDPHALLAWVLGRGPAPELRPWG